MTTLVLELPPDVYERLLREARRSGDSLQVIAQRLLQNGLEVTVPASRVREVLLADGLLTEPGPEMRERARRSTATLEEVQAAFDAAEGRLLSQIVIEMRGPKE